MKNSDVRNKKKYLVFSVLLLFVVVVFLVLVQKEKEEEMRNHLQIAEQFLSERDYDAAMQEYQSACDINLSDVGVVTFGEKLYSAMAMEQELAGDIDGAIAILEKATIELAEVKDNAEINVRLETLRQLTEDMQNPDLSAMTEELIRIVDEWRYYYDMATPEEKDEIFSVYADAFQNYIVLETMGTDQVVLQWIRY